MSGSELKTQLFAAQMSLHVSMSFPTQINNVPGYTSWDDDTSALLNIAVSEVILPKDELTTLCGGGEGMHSHLYSFFFFCILLCI